MMDPLEPLTHACHGVLDRPEADQDSLLWFANGTTALCAALRAAHRLAGSGRSPNALLPASVCPQVYLAVTGAGLAPVFVASDPLAGDYRLDLDALEGLPAGEAVALVWVHQYGCIAQGEELAALCRSKAWVLIEDAALSFGARDRRGAAAGTLGDCGVLSFGTGKTVEAGYGGALLVNRGAIAQGLGPLLRIEQESVNRGASASGAGLAAFDREFKRIYNTRYAALRGGLLRNELHAGLSDCLPCVEALSAERLVLALTPEMISSAPKRVAARNARAQWWRSRLSESDLPVTGMFVHAAGTYWRFNLLLEPAVRHAVLLAALAAGLPISSWHPPLYWLVREAPVIGNTANEIAFADGVLNLWVEGIERWDEYLGSIGRLLRETEAVGSVNS